MHSLKRSRRRSSTGHESTTSDTSHVGFISSRPRNDVNPPTDNDSQGGAVNMSNSHISSENDYIDNDNEAGAVNTPTSRVSENDCTDNGYGDEPVKGAHRDIDEATATTFHRPCDTQAETIQQRVRSTEQVTSPSLSHAARSNIEAERHRKRARCAKSRSRDTVPSLPRKARPSVAEITLSSRHDDDSALFSGVPQKLTHTTLRRVSTHTSFFATIVQDDRPMPVFSYGSSMALIERALGDAGYIEGPAIIPLALNSWLVIGFLNELHDASGSAIDQEATQGNSISTSTHRYIRRRKATDTDNFPSTDEEQSSDEENSSDEGSSASEDVYSSDEGERPSIKAKKVQWSPSEDARLQKYMRDYWKWSEIFARFPDRTQGAVRLRGHMLRQKAERESSH